MMNITETTDWVGKCHDCAKPLCVRAVPQDDGIHVSGGAVFDCGAGRIYLKCPVCYRRKPFLIRNKDCDVYTGVMPAPPAEEPPAAAAIDESPDDYLLLNEK